MNNTDSIAKHFEKVRRRLSPRARGVYALLRDYETGLSALDCMRALGVAGNSMTRRITDLRDAGFVIERSSHIDKVSKVRFSKYKITGVKSLEHSA